MIYNIVVHSTEYRNMTPASITKLFRKLNNGTSLGNFQKGLARNITIKQSLKQILKFHNKIAKLV